jgi:hypothetical protein
MESDIVHHHGVYRKGETGPIVTAMGFFISRAGRWGHV